MARTCKHAWTVVGGNLVDGEPYRFSTCEICGDSVWSGEDLQKLMDYKKDGKFLFMHAWILGMIDDHPVKNAGDIINFYNVECHDDPYYEPFINAKRVKFNMDLLVKDKLVRKLPVPMNHRKFTLTAEGRALRQRDRGNEPRDSVAT